MTNSSQLRSWLGLAMGLVFDLTREIAPGIRLGIDFTMDRDAWEIRQEPSPVERMMRFLDGCAETRREDIARLVGFWPRGAGMSLGGDYDRFWAANTHPCSLGEQLTMEDLPEMEPYPIAQVQQRYMSLLAESVLYPREHGEFWPRAAGKSAQRHAITDPTEPWHAQSRGRVV